MGPWTNGSLALLLGLTVLSLASCGNQASNPDEVDDQGQGGSAGARQSGSGGTPGGDGGSFEGSGGTTNMESSPELPTDVRFTYDPGQDEGTSTCAATQVTSTEAFLDMFVILDKSGSMTIGPVSGANDPAGYCDIDGTIVDSRWCNSIHSLYGFFSDPSSVGTGVAFTEFSNGSCDAFGMDVKYGRLQEQDTNGQLLALKTELNDDDPANGTNTEGAVRTLIAETAAHVPTAGRRSIAVLITDGIPSETCWNAETETEHLTRLNGLLVDHFVNTKIPTFVVGVDGVKADRLEILAAGAGAKPHSSHCIGSDLECSYYSVGDGDPQVFVEALKDIRGEALGCEYLVPEAEVGVEDLDTLVIDFRPDASSPLLRLKQVSDEASCALSDQYWVTTAPDQDSIIGLCPQACELRGIGASIDISLSCEGN